MSGPVITILILLGVLSVLTAVIGGLVYWLLTPGQGSTSSGRSWWGDGGSTGVS
jgi:hypothetical protein